MPITNFPAYTGTALSRNLTQAQFDEAEEYFQAYQAAWAAQMNDTTIPQLNTLETTCANSAATATTKAGEALASANNAGDSATLAGKWASEAVDVIVQSGKYSAFHWATKAYEYVATLATGAINDSITALNATWSSTKLSTLTKDQINSATTKSTPINADSVAIVDSADSNRLKRVPWSDALATAKAYFDTLYIVATQLFGFKNYIINGNFDVWQYGISQTASGYGSDDRWNNSNIGSTKTHSRVACTDTERALFNASYFSRTVVSSVTGASNYVNKDQAIEDVTKLSGKTVTISFWAKADSNKNISVDVYQVFGTGGTPSSVAAGTGILVPLTTTWQKKTVTWQVPSIVGKTLGTDGVHTSATRLRFFFDAGSTFATISGGLGQQSGTFDIAQVQLEEGSVATPFEQRPYGLELSLCQRYYELLINSQYAPSDGTNNVWTGVYHTKKRIIPTLTYSANFTFTSLASTIDGFYGYASGIVNSRSLTSITASAEL